MNNEKKDFIKAEIEVIRFEKNDVIATSTVNSGGWGGEQGGDLGDI